MIPCAARTKQGAVGRRMHERLCFLKRNPPRRRLYSSTFCPHWSSRVLHPEQGNGRGNTGFMNDRRTLALSAVRESKCCLLLVLTRTSPAGLARFRSLRGLTARGGRRRCLRAPLPRQRHPGSRGARRGRRAGRHLEIMLGIMLEGLARVYRLRIHKVVLTHQHMRAHTQPEKQPPATPCPPWGISQGVRPHICSFGRRSFGSAHSPPHTSPRRWAYLGQPFLIIPEARVQRVFCAPYLTISLGPCVNRVRILDPRASWRTPHAPRFPCAHSLRHQA